MSILIKDMEMPKSCGNCYMFSFLSDSCRITNYITEEMNDKMLDRRFDDCPLVPVPPHGRLIDADAIDWVEGRDEQDRPVYLLLKIQIDDIPTIIEAEEVDND